MMLRVLRHALSAAHPLLPDVFAAVDVDQLIRLRSEVMRVSAEAGLTSSLLLVLLEATVKSGQNRRSASLSRRLWARAGPCSRPPGSDQKKFAQSGSSNMKGMSRARILAMLMTLCCSVELRQLLSTASPSLSTSCPAKVSKFTMFDLC